MHSDVALTSPSSHGFDKVGWYTCHCSCTDSEAVGSEVFATDACVSEHLATARELGSTRSHLQWQTVELSPTCLSSDIGISLSSGVGHNTLQEFVLVKGPVPKTRCELPLPSGWAKY